MLTRVNATLARFGMYACVGGLLAIVAVVASSSLVAIASARARRA